MAGAMEVGEFLAHWGIKGQKWGVRRRSAGPGHLAGGSSPRSADSAQAANHLHTAKKTGLHALSNVELQALNTRLSLEQNYAKLTAPQQKKGKSFIQKALAAGKITNEVIKFMDTPAGKKIAGNLGTPKGGSGASKAKASAHFAANVAAAAAASRAKRTYPDEPIDFGTVSQLIPSDHWLPRGSS